MKANHECPRSFSLSILLLLLGLGFVFAVAAAFPGRALAEAKVASSDPADGASVQIGLTSIVITFTEEVSIDQSSAQLVAQGQPSLEGVTTQVDRADGKVMKITTSPLQEGRYTVRWHAVAVNGNGLTDGQINFTVGNPPPAAEATPTLQPPQPTATPLASTASASTGSGTSGSALTWVLLAVIAVLLGVVVWQALALRRRTGGGNIQQK